MAVEAVEATESLPKEAGLVGLDGPLDELDLTKMLVENFENNGPEETSPSGDAVEEAEPVEESTEEAGDTEHVLSQEESETESEVEAAPEQAEPEGEQEEPEWLQRRIDRFTRKLRLAEEERDELEKEVQSLKSQVEQVPAAVQQNGNPVAHIRNERELNDIASLAERRLGFAEEMEDRLLDNPEAVEKILRQQGVELTDGYYPNIASLFLQNHPDADRLAELDLVAGELEFAGIQIDAEYGHVVGLLVGGEQELAGGVDAEVARGGSPGGLVAKRGQLAVLLVDPEHGDAVVAAVRAVEKLAAWVNEDLGSAVSLDRVGHGGDGLQCLESAALGPVAKGGHRLLNLVDDVGEFAAWVKAEVARAGAGFQLGAVKLGLGDCAGFFVEPEHQHLVDAEVGCEGELVVRADMDRVGVRGLLT